MIPSLLLSIALVALSLAANIYVWIQCAAHGSIPAYAIAGVMAFIYVLLFLFGVSRTKRTGKPYLTIIAIVLFVIGMLVYIFRYQIIDIYNNVFPYIPHDDELSLNNYI